MFIQQNTFITILFIFLCCHMLSGCDNIIGIFQEGEEKESSGAEYATTSEGMMVLTGLLDEQQRLIDEIGFAKQTGNTDLMKSSFKQVMRLEQDYQEGFDQFEPTMSRAEIREISNRHSEIIKRLPPLK